MNAGAGLRLAATLARDRVRMMRPGARKFRPIRFEPVTEVAETLPCKPGLFDEAQLDRVVACGFKATLPDQIAKLRATQFVERPMQTATVRDAVVIAGEIFRAEGRHFMSDRQLSLSAIAKIEELDEPVTLANTEQGLKYFGHWLQDDCAMHRVLAEEIGGRMLSMQRPHWPDARIYERLFGQTWDERVAFRTPHLTLARDLGFSRKKRGEFDLLRAALRRTTRPGEPGAIVYLARGTSGVPREVVNEAALTERLEAAGVRIVRPETGDETVAALLDARLIITVEGSQACHAVYGLAAGGAMLILQPPDRFYNPHVEWTRLLGMDYGIVVGETREAGFHIHPDEVLSMIDRLLAAGA